MQSKVGRGTKWLFTTAICTSMLDPFGFTQAAPDTVRAGALIGFRPATTLTK